MTASLAALSLLALLCTPVALHAAPEGNCLQSGRVVPQQTVVTEWESDSFPPPESGSSARNEWNVWLVLPVCLGGAGYGVFRSVRQAERERCAREAICGESAAVWWKTALLKARSAADLETAIDTLRGDPKSGR